MKQPLLVISGPTGCGKNVFMRALLKRFSNLQLVVTTTSRPMRADDQEGRDYNFVSAEEFERMINAGALIEWARVHGNYYGIPRGSIDSIQSEARVPSLIIDVQGGATIKAEYPEALLVFIKPEPFEKYLERLKQDRGSEKNFEERVKSIQFELKEAKKYDIVVENTEGRLENATNLVIEKVGEYLGGLDV